MRVFGWLYYAVVAVMLAAVGLLPWLGPLSYRALGFDPRSANDGTFAAFRAHLATSALRQQFVSSLLALALTVIALSLAGLVLRARRRTSVPWLLLAVTIIGAAGVVMITIGGLVAGVCC